MPRWNQTTEERLMAKIDRKANGCWEWQGCLRGSKTHKYGVLCHQGKQDGAHRVSFRLFKGEIPEGMNVCHSCDNPRCVNPDHLFIGSDSANMSDMTAKGRHPYPLGETHHRAKLTNDAVRAIRASAQSHNQLARAYGVTKRTIINVRQRKVYDSVL